MGLFFGACSDGFSHLHCSGGFSHLYPFQAPSKDQQQRLGEPDESAGEL